MLKDQLNISKSMLMDTFVDLLLYKYTKRIINKAQYNLNLSFRSSSIDNYFTNLFFTVERSFISLSLLAVNSLFCCFNPDLLSFFDLGVILPFGVRQVYSVRLGLIYDMSFLFLKVNGDLF